jgi:hypothetical protein
MPNPFQKKNKGETKNALNGTSLPALAGGSVNLTGTKSGSSNAQKDQAKLDQAVTAKAPVIKDSTELVSDKPSNGGMAEKMTSTFSKLNPFSKKGIAGKKQKQTL